MIRITYACVVFWSFLILQFVAVQRCFSWGFKAHKLINKKAIFFLHQDLLPFYKKYYLYVSEHAPDPDKRKRVQKNEKYKHYINIDLYDDYPFKKVPQKLKQIVTFYGQDTVTERGLLPWHIEKVCQQLTTAFKDKNGDKILKISADLGHYVGDLHVPLHLTKNYNGQLTQQHGIHSLWETQTIHHVNIDTINFDLKPVRYFTNIADATWSSLLKTYPLIDDILKSEKRLSAAISESEKYHIKVKKGTAVKTYSQFFTKQFLDANYPVIKQQLYQASYFLACLIYTCWVDAGKPNLTTVIPKSVAPSLIDDDNDEGHNS